MTVEVLHPAAVEEFLALAGAFLAEREAEHNLILGICSSLRLEPDRYAGPPYLAVARSAGEVVAAAVRTPPFGPVLSEVDDPGAVDAFADDLGSSVNALPSVLGPVGAAAAFARSWTARTGAPARLVLRERIHRADSATHPDGVPGAMRRAAPDEAAPLTAWWTAFADEALPPEWPREDPEDAVRRRLADREGGVFVWDDGVAVSLAAAGQPTPNGIRIGPVYTPPERRGRGYATALVAALTGAMLGSGRRYCFLFTDLANPTSNAIYRRIGYRPVSDVDQYVFDRPA